MGTREGHHLVLRNRTPEELREIFPKLLPGTYEHTSEATARYNCVSFANGDTRKWWESGRHGGRFYWPEKVPYTLDGWIDLFAQQGYKMTDNHGIEDGVGKVAIYVNLNDMEPEHVAISDGVTWKSKLGRWQDVAHVSLDVLEGESAYGMVGCVLQRPIGRGTLVRNRCRCVHLQQVRLWPSPVSLFDTPSHGKHERRQLALVTAHLRK